MSKYNSGIGKKAAVASIGALVTGAIIGCDSNKGHGANDKYDSWMNTDGAAGKINMEAVKSAIDTAANPTELENRLNEIYEGKGLVLVKVSDNGDGRKLIAGYEDLNNNGSIDPAQDDKLFSAIVGEKSYEIHGAGVNSHYRHSGSHGMTTGQALFLMWMFSPGWRPYYTPMGRVTTIRSYRTTYRSSPGYQKQRTANKSYQSKAKAKNPAAYKKAQGKTSKARSGFQKSQAKGMKGGVKGKGGSYKGGS